MEAMADTIGCRKTCGCVVTA